MGHRRITILPRWNEQLPLPIFHLLIWMRKWIPAICNIRNNTKCIYLKMCPITNQRYNSVFYLFQSNLQWQQTQILLYLILLYTFKRSSIKCVRFSLRNRTPILIWQRISYFYLTVFDQSQNNTTTASPKHYWF